MTIRNYELGDVVLKVFKETQLLQTERAIVELRENTLALPIIFNRKQQGYVFHGQGRLLIDALVETIEGAIGRSIDRELNEPFLMLGNAGTLQRYFANVNEHEFAKMGYENQQGFIANADDLLKHFFNDRAQDQEVSDIKHGSIFAFSDSNGELDILVVGDSKLAYSAKNTVFVSNRNRTVLKNPNEVIVSNNRKSVIIRK